MTSTPVMGSANLQNTGLLNTTPSTGKVGNSDFKSFMDMAGGKTETETVKATKTEPVKKSSAEIENRTDSAKDVTMVSKPEKAESAEKQVDETDVKEVVETIKEVMEAVSNEFEVSDEDIERALETLGLTVFDLLNVAKLPTIVAVLTGNGDVLSLTTDENLYESLTNLTQAVDEIVTELTSEVGIEKEDFTAALNAFEIPKEVAVEKEDTTEVKEKVIASENEEQASFETKINVTRNERNTQRVGSASENAVRETEDEMPTEQTVSRPGEKMRDFESNTESGSRNAHMNFAQNLLKVTAEVLTENSENVSYTSFDAANIMNQITEGIDVNVSAETSEINLRLHPESLGSVTVKVSSNNEGVLTATFTAQNESVKAVIEAQTIVLRETLESKGITVEAIEVAVQSHQFERNLSDSENGSRQQSETKKRGIRRINLSDAAEEIGETEDDSLVREMMAQSGNTIDYSA